ncbi:MAG: DUF1850 domain-containing protein [Rhodospirillaceae bacterium]
MSLCVALALSHAIVAMLPDRITLTWRHTVEKVVWEEDYVASEDAIVLSEARIKAFGAGMDLPDNAWFSEGAWHFRPQLPPMKTVHLVNSEYGDGYEVCAEGRCFPLNRIARGEQVVIAACSGAGKIPS